MYHKPLAWFCAVFFSYQLSTAQTGLATATIADTVPDTMEEIVISAQKIGRPKKITAQYIHTIPAGFMQNLQARNTADVLAASGLAYVQKSQQGGGSITIRGLEASRNILVIDGIRMNNLIYRSGHLQNIVTVDHQSLERIELLQGPASTMYGSDALGGAVCMYTLAPVFSSERKKTKVNASTRFGSVNNEFTHHADFRFSDAQWAAVTSFTHSTFGDLKSGKNKNPFYHDFYGLRPFYVDRINGTDSLVKNNQPFLQRNSGYTQYDLLQKIAYKTSGNTEHGINIQFSNSGNVPRFDRLTDPNGDGLKYAEWYYGPQTRFMVAYSNDLKTGHPFWGRMRNTVYFQQIEESRHTRRFKSDELQQRFEKVNLSGVSIDFYNQSKHRQYNWGVDAQTSRVKSTAHEMNILSGEKTKLDTRYPDGKNSMHTLGLYYTEIRHLQTKFKLNSGVRLGYSQLMSTLQDNSFYRLPFQSITQKNLVYSGNLGLIYLPSETWRWNMVLTTGFRVPNIDDLAKVFESGPGKLIVPNEKIKPERTISYEWGVEQTKAGRYNWDLHMFYTQFIDAIVTDNFRWQGQDSLLYEGTKSVILANQNKRRAYICGVQGKWQANWRQDLKFMLSGMYTYGRIQSEQQESPLDHIPPLVLRATWNYEKKIWGAELSIEYNGKKNLKDYMLNGEDNEQYATPEGMPAWATANLRLRLKAGKFVMVHGGVENIFDTQYRTFASGINAPGRNLFVTVKLTR